MSGWGASNVSLTSNYVELRRLRLSGSPGTGAFASGDGFNGRVCTHALVVDCLASGNAGDGFAAGANATLTGCDASNNSLSGYSGGNLCATNCSADSNQSAGWFVVSGGRLINCTATGVRARGTQGEGFLVGDGAVLIGCQALGNTFTGFYLNGSGCLVSSCAANNNAGDGFFFTSNNLLTNNVATGNGLHGFVGSGSNNRIDGNHAVANTNTGFLSASATADFTIRNTAYANATNYNPSSGVYLGPLGLPSTATSPWANF